MAFPTTARYFIRFRHSDTGLSPTFTYFKRADTLANLTPPVISELQGGTYYFDYTFTLSTDPDVVFEVDGGASIPTEEVRYISDALSAKDHYLDEPISQVVDDVWNDSTDRGAGSKGDFVEQIGVPTDASNVASLFGKMLLHKESIRGDTAGTGDGKAVDEVAPDIKGPDDVDLTEIAGTGFVPNTDSLVNINVAAGTYTGPSASQNADAVWNEALGDHLLPGSTGEALDTAQNITVDNAAIATEVWDKNLSSYSTPNQAGTFLKDTATVSANIGLIKAKTDNLPVNTSATLQGMVDQLTRTLGLLHENSVLDSTVFDGDNNLLAGRLRIYDTKANAESAASTSPAGGTTGLLATYNINADYTGGNLVKYTVVKV